jgi:hypothetical protein
MRERWQVQMAERVGRVLRAAGTTLPGVVGASLVCVGLALAWLPLGVVAAGGALLVVDWRLADVSKPVRPPRRADGRQRLRSVA